MSSTLDVDGGVAEWDPAGVEFAALCASPVGLGGRDLGDRLVEIDRARRALEAATVAVLDEADRGGSFRDDGHITLGSWARATVNWSYAETSSRVRTVDLVRLCPSVAGELARGRLGVAHTFELARARANPRAGDAIAECVDELVKWAETLDFDGFRKVVRRWEQLADVDGAHQGHEAAHEGRRAAITRLDDTFHLNAQFGVAYGTAMAEILDAFAEAEYQAEWEKIKAEHGDAACRSMMDRTASQRRADALFAIFMASVADERGKVPGPLVNIVCDLQTFEEHVARLVGGHVPAEGGDGGTEHDASEPGSSVSMGTGFGLRRCETIDGDPVDPSDVVAGALIGHIRRVVVNSAGVVVNCGRKTRLFKGVAREMVWLLGTTCCWPGCGHRLGVQVDHLDEYASRDGPTDQENADPLHGWHNRFKTTHGYRVTRDERGIIHIYRPDGTEIRPR